MTIAGDLMGPDLSTAPPAACGGPMVHAGANDDHAMRRSPCRNAHLLNSTLTSSHGVAAVRITMRYSHYDEVPSTATNHRGRKAERAGLEGGKVLASPSRLASPLRLVFSRRETSPRPAACERVCPTPFLLRRGVVFTLRDPNGVRCPRPAADAPCLQAKGPRRLRSSFEPPRFSF